MNNEFFGKTMENVRKHRGIKLVTTERRRNCFVSEPNYHTAKVFSKHLLAMEIKKAQIAMNKLAYLGLSVLELSKILIHKFWYDILKPKYGEKAKLCYMDADSFFIYIKADDIYKEITEDVVTRFDTSNYTLDRPFHNGKNTKIIGLMKNELRGKS